MAGGCEPIQRLIGPISGSTARRSQWQNGRRRQLAPGGWHEHKQQRKQPNDRRNSMDLGALLVRLSTYQEKAQRIWEANMREEYGNDWKAEAPVWPTLEYAYDGDPRWHCGFRCRTFFETDQRIITRDGWALRAVRRTPTDAVRAMLEDMG